LFLTQSVKRIDKIKAEYLLFQIFEIHPTRFLTLAGKKTKSLSNLISLKVAERSEAKRAKRIFALY